MCIRKSTIGLAFLLISIAADAWAAEKFQKLTGAQITARFTGMELTDGVHSADVFGPNGTLRSYAMNRKTTAKWSVKNNELCFDRGVESGGCYQVWMAGAKVELRRQGLDLAFLEGVLQRPAARN